LALVVNCTVYFNHHFCCRAVEVGDEGADWVLLAEAEFASVEAEEAP
jgi:hypothetical protein